MSDRAVKITPETAVMIANANDDVRPRTDTLVSYFITSSDDEKQNLILPAHVFRRCFEFVGPELENQFAEVKEL